MGEKAWYLTQHRLGTVYSVKWVSFLGGGLNQSDPPRAEEEKENKYRRQQISGADQRNNKKMNILIIDVKGEIWGTA